MNRDGIRHAARLRRSREITAVRASGRSLRRETFTARAARTDAAQSRIAVVAPRSVGTAVARNRARRRVREAFRRAFASPGPLASVDLVITVRPTAVAVDFGTIEADARAALADLAR